MTARNQQRQKQKPATVKATADFSTALLTEGVSSFGRNDDVWLGAESKWVYFCSWQKKDEIQGSFTPFRMTTSKRCAGV
jgi:hypothetical protein